MAKQPLSHRSRSRYQHISCQKIGSAQPAIALGAAGAGMDNGQMLGIESLTTYALANPINRAVLDALPALDVPDPWLVSGCIFQSVWNGMTGRAPDYGILDYDVFYFDPDLSFEAEDRVIQRCARAFASLGVDVQVRNQARVHLWYPEKFNRPYPPLGSAVESLSRFLAPACAVGVQRRGDAHAIAAPFGLEDIFSMTIRRNPSVGGSSDEYDAKSARWKARWPEITVQPWS